MKSPAPTTSATGGRSAISATELLQIGPELRGERLVRAESLEVTQRAREIGAQRGRVVERGKPRRLAMRALRREERELGREDDVGERELVADQEPALRRQRLIDPGK